MPSSWPFYSFAIVAAMLGVLVPILIGAVVRRLIAVRVKAPIASAPTERARIGARVNLRFFIGLSVAALVLCEIFLFLPVVAGFSASDGPFPGLWVLLSLLTFSVVGLFYSVRKGDLSWQKTLHDPEERA